MIYTNKKLKDAVIPTVVLNILAKLERAGFEAYVVGGCVRDLLMGKTPTDWDVTTNAKPEEVQEVFGEAHSFYENDFGTVGVKTESEDSSLSIVEVTTYRTEFSYSDSRRPDKVEFVEKLEDDLARRDFTMNSIAVSYEPKARSYEIIDYFGGQEDIENKLIRAVGEPDLRFSEDALRMLRAVRFASTLGFQIEDATLKSIKKHSSRLAIISQERIRDEFAKLINGDGAYEAMELLRETGLLEYIIPELLEGVGVGQNLHHIYTVWEHNSRALKYTVEKKYAFPVRLAALLHDVGKPRSKRGEGYNSTFYGHEVIGARMTDKIMRRLKFPSDVAEKIVKLVRWHLFYYNVGEVTETSVRRLVANIGRENVEDLLKVREADRIGSGTPKAVPYKLRHLKFMIDKVARDPVSPKMLKINGNDIMNLLEIQPGPKIGMIMNALMEEVLEDPARNTLHYLEGRTHKLAAMPENALMELSQKGKMKTLEEEEREVGKIKQKHRVN